MSHRAIFNHGIVQIYKGHFVYAPSQWETTLYCNVVSHWLGAYTKLFLDVYWNILIFCIHLTHISPRMTVSLHHSCEYVISAKYTINCDFTNPIQIYCVPKFTYYIYTCFCNKCKYKKPGLHYSITTINTNIRNQGCIIYLLFMINNTVCAVLSCYLKEGPHSHFQNPLWANSKCQDYVYAKWEFQLIKPVTSVPHGTSIHHNHHLLATTPFKSYISLCILVISIQLFITDQMYL